MTGSLPILNLFYLLSIFISSGGVHGVNIQFYRYENFTGLLWERNSSAVCSNIPEDKSAEIYSIRTDTCFIAYLSPNCVSLYSQKYMPGDIILSYWDLYSIESFQVCNQEEGGSQLNLDITKYYEYGFVPDVLESYKNVCSCVNVPQYVQNMSKWSINNHHNALLAYYEPDCSENKWNSIFIAAGHISYSTNVHDHKKTDEVTKTTFKYQSFGPDPNSTYFHINCNASHVTTTESSKTFESTTGNEMNENADIEKRLEVLTNQIAELQTNQSDIRNEQTVYFANLTQSFTQLTQGFLDFTAKIKSDLHDLFA